MKIKCEKGLNVIHAFVSKINTSSLPKNLEVQILSPYISCACEKVLTNSLCTHCLDSVESNRDIMFMTALWHTASSTYSKVNMIFF